MPMPFLLAEASPDTVATLGYSVGSALIGGLVTYLLGLRRQKSIDLVSAVRVTQDQQRIDLASHNAVLSQQGKVVDIAMAITATQQTELGTLRTELLDIRRDNEKCRDRADAQAAKIRTQSRKIRALMGQVAGLMARLTAAGLGTSESPTC